MFILNLGITNHMLSAIGANPMGKARAASSLLSNAQASMSRLQTEATNAADGNQRGNILGKISIVAYIISLAQFFFKEAMDQQKRDQESTQAVHKLAEPAR